MNFGSHLWRALVCYALGLLFSCCALAQSVATRLVVAGGTATSIKVVPGGSVSMDVRLDIVTALIWGTGFTFTQLSPGANGFFSITGRSFAGSPFNDTTSGTPDATVLAPASALLDPTNNDNLGRTTIGLVGIPPANNVLAVNLTLASNPLAPLGTYTFGPTPGVSFATDEPFNDYNMSGQTPFTIIVGQTLSVIKSGTGSGTVTADTGLIACGATCSDIYPGTVVTLTATPAAGSTFAGWSGGGCSGTATCVVTVDAAKSVTATFNQQQTFALDVTKSGAGAGTVTSSPTGINCGATCSFNFNPGTPVTLTPASGVGSVFAGWSGACTGSGACVVTMDAAKSVNAVFDLQTFALNVTTSGTGGGAVTSSPVGINCGGTCSSIFNFGTLVTLTPAPVAGSVLASWSGACSGSGACVVTMDAAKTVNAVFNIAPPVLSSVLSRRVHGTAGTFDLLLGLIAANPTTEPRQGPAFTLVFTFDKPVTTGVAAVTAGTATAGVPTFSGNQMIVPLTGVANQQYVTVTLSSLASTDGSTDGVASIRIGFLLGDVNQNRGVSLSDLAQVNAQVAQFVTAANFRFDVNASGTLSLADTGITNTQVTKVLPAP